MEEFSCILEIRKALEERFVVKKLSAQSVCPEKCHRETENKVIYKFEIS